jgi:hypothetical protein
VRSTLEQMGTLLELESPDGTRFRCDGYHNSDPSVSKLGGSTEGNAWQSIERSIRVSRPTNKAQRVANKTRKCYLAGMDAGRKRVLAIIAEILVARHLKKTEEDLKDTRESPRTSSMLSSASVWAERILRKIDGKFEVQ